MTKKMLHLSTKAFSSSSGPSGHLFQRWKKSLGALLRHLWPQLLQVWRHKKISLQLVSILHCSNRSLRSNLDHLANTGHPFTKYSKQSVHKGEKNSTISWCNFHKKKNWHKLFTSSEAKEPLPCVDLFHLISPCARCYTLLRRSQTSRRPAAVFWEEPLHRFSEYLHIKHFIWEEQVDVSAGYNRSTRSARRCISENTHA